MSKRWLKLWPGARSLLSQTPLGAGGKAPEVVVCTMLPILVHVTVLPTRTVRFWLAKSTMEAETLPD